MACATVQMGQNTGLEKKSYQTKKMATAVLICGLYRSLDVVVDNLLQKFILPNDADVFLVLSNNPPEGATAVNKLESRIKARHILTIPEIEKPLQEMKQRMQTNFSASSLFEQVVQYYQSTGIQFIALSKAYDLVVAYETQTSRRYKHIIKVRTDLTHGYDLHLESSNDKFQQITRKFQHLLGEQDFRRTMEFWGLVFCNNVDLFERYVRRFGCIDVPKRDAERTSEGYLESFVDAHISSRLLGGAYYENTKLHELFHNPPAKFRFFYLINDCVLAFHRDDFEYVKNFHLWLGNASHRDKTCLFWTPEYQLMQYLDEPAHHFVAMHIYLERGR